MSKEFKLIRQGIKTLAYLHFGKSKFKCSDCKKSPELRKELNCDLEEREEPVTVIDGEEVYACPIALIPDLVFDLFDKYLYVKEIGTNIEYEQQDFLFWVFYKEYERHKNQIENDEREMQRKKMDKQYKSRK